jgi:hypothetical protein
MTTRTLRAILFVDDEIMDIAEVSGCQLRKNTDLNAQYQTCIKWHLSNIMDAERNNLEWYIRIVPVRE